MNKFSTMFVGLGAIAMMASCSNDEPANNGATPDTPNGDVAYMTVEIKSPEREIPSRATSTPGYEESDKTPIEHQVGSVQFLFFGSNGEYEFTVKADDTTFKPADNDANNGGGANVEYVGTKNVIILENVTAKNHPNYVITVLNAPSDFEAGATMAETAEKLTAYATSFPATNGPATPFVMTTSSFLGAVTGANGGERHDDTYYYATKLNSNDFMTTLEAAQTNTQPVEIYVERLAAKVQMSAEGDTEIIDNHQVYKIQQTLAGGDDQTSGGDAISDVDLYVEILGWGLNATTKQSYMGKKLDTTWSEDDLWAGWNNSGDWRSFWGMSYIYGPKFNQDELLYESPAAIVAKGHTLNGNTRSYEYCYENTNNTSIFEEVADGPLTLDGNKVGVHNAKVTHAVLRTRIYQKNDEGHLVAPELVNFRGVTYTGESYKALLLNKLKADDKLNYWIKVSETGDNIEWRTVKSTDFKLVRNEAEGHALGAVSVVLNTTETIYTRDAAGIGTPNANAETELNAALAAAYDFAKYPATGTDKGDSFYYIPIEHLASTPGQTNAVEGYYGVVRNHWYKLVVRSFSKVGHLVFDPETDNTPIVPDKPEDPKYFVGASVNIHSWKIVNQNVDL